jgi:hypothetical protein
MTAPLTPRFENCHNIDVDGWHGQVFPFHGTGPFPGGYNMTTVAGAILPDGSLMMVWAGGSDQDRERGQIRITVEPENKCVPGALQAIGGPAVPYLEPERHGQLAIIGPLLPPLVHLAYTMPNGSLRDSGLTFDVRTRQFSAPTSAPTMRHG